MERHASCIDENNADTLVLYSPHNAGVLLFDQTDLPFHFEGNSAPAGDLNGTEKGKFGDLCFPTMADSSFVGAFKTALDGKLLYCNVALAAILEYSTVQEVYEEKAFLKVHDPKDWERMLAELYQKGLVTNYLFSVETRAGSSRAVLISAALVDDVICGTVAEISASDETNIRLRTIKDFSHKIQQCGDEQTICNVASDFLKGCGYPNYIGLLNDSGLRLSFSVASFDPNSLMIAEQYLGHTLDNLTFSINENINPHHRNLHQNKCGSDGQFAKLSLKQAMPELADILHFEKSLVIPLIVNNRCLGVIDVSVREPGEEDHLFLESIADWIALAIHHCRLCEELRRLKRDGDTGCGQHGDQAKLISKSGGGNGHGNGSGVDPTRGITAGGNEGGLKANLNGKRAFFESAMIRTPGNGGPSESLDTKMKAHLYPACLDASNDSILFVDREGVILYANHTCAKMFGREDIIGKSVHELFDASFPLNPATVPKSLLSAGAWTGEWQYKSKDRTIALHMSASTFKDASGNIVGFIGCADDSTNYHELEQQLRQAQKMESIGTLAAGIAHDLKNFLSGIQRCSSILLSRMNNGEEHCAELESIEMTAQSATDLANRLLTVSRAKSSERLVCLINQIVEKTVNVLKGSLAKNIRTELCLDENLPSILCNPGQVEQVMMNLGINAAEAMPDGGILSIRTGTAKLDESYPDLHPGAYVFITVKDTGVGIPAELTQKIFEPLFTTKEEGTGLGLSVVYGIVREHGGAVGVDSRPGVGSRFTVYLPIEGAEGHRD